MLAFLPVVVVNAAAAVTAAPVVIAVGIVAADAVVDDCKNIADFRLI